MLRRSSIPLLLGAAVLVLAPTRAGKVFAQTAICGQFTDVPASSPFCPYILQAFISNLSQGTSSTTYDPSDAVTRDQQAVFITRTMDQTIHRTAAARIAMGKTWLPTASNGGITTDVGGSVNDLATDGSFLWIARTDSKVLKVSLADRRILETWSMSSGVPRKLGLFAGQVWMADDQGRLHSFNPTNTAGIATLLFSGTATGITVGSPSMAFDGTSIWLASANGPKVFVYPVSTSGGVTFTMPANVDGLVFDGTYMWVLLANATLVKLGLPAFGSTPTVVETLPIPGAVNDCRMLYDGTNIWIPIGATGTLYVVRPTQNLAGSPSQIVANQTIPDVIFPYVAAFDGENVMIGGANNGTVALFKATNLGLIRTFASGAIAVRGIASDGRTFNIGDALGNSFFQY
ncbi:MAG TPA: S-layer homology domain-containing protein [Bryobacteraceae bacterium]|nr:S-layer homology domain-containing protein [Bryobacteraceae bacterium]